ncbi:ammonium transporter [Thermoleophilia bacterium SCSIO 60948]|nr:ammonium transporter [Thermoleophilia bacterium SCSIO 60948]
MRMRKRLGLAATAASVALLALPGSALAQGPSTGALKGQLDTTWVMVAAVLVLFMQAGFLFLEIGFSRGKNVGAGVAKIFVNLGIATIAWWAVGYGISSLSGNKIFGTEGFFYALGDNVGGVTQTGADVALMLFGMLFCAVSLAIVWGTTLERIKFSAYAIYAVFFAAIIYPLVAHGVYGGGLLADVGGKPVMDFAGSTVVHLTGAVGGLAALLLLGPRIGKYASDGSPRAIPGHSMPIVGLGVLILWVGWYGFNAGSTFGTSGNAFANVALNTQLAAAAGALAACATIFLKTRTVDVGMVGNGAVAGLVAITAPSGYVNFWAAPIIGVIAGVLVVFGVLIIEKYLDDPVGALSAHGLAGIWGTLSIGIFGAPALVLEGAAPGIWYGITGDASFGSTLGQLAVQAVGVVAGFILVFVLSIAIFAAIKATIGLRVSREEELAGVDISSHGMYGYPEQFIPTEELSTPPMTPHVAGTPVATNSTAAGVDRPTTV